MRINKIGEFGLIEKFKKLIKTDSSVIQGSGDDCAVMKLDKFNYQLFTCDMIVEDVDFTLKEKPYSIGRKSLGIQVSDIASCGGEPRYCVISLGLTPNINVEFVDELFKGMLDMAKKYHINIVGGDISKSRKLTIDVSMLGVVEKNNLVLRNGAKEGDIIFVTGSLGGSIRGKHLNFTPRLKEARYLVKNFRVHAMIDISDGLAQDLGHILKQSKVGAVLYEDLIPVAEEARNFNEALCMGEDFELLFTLPRKDARKIMRNKSIVFKPIGEIMDKKQGLTLVDRNNKQRTIKPKGFRHF